MLKPTKTQIRTAKLLSKMGVKTLFEKAIQNAHQDAKYYCDEWNNHFQTHGYHTDSYHIGIHNAHNYYPLSAINEAIESVKFIEALGGMDTVNTALLQAKSESDLLSFNGGEWTYQAKDLRRPLMLYVLYKGAKDSLK